MYYVVHLLKNIKSNFIIEQTQYFQYKHVYNVSTQIL